MKSTKRQSPIVWGLTLVILLLSWGFVQAFDGSAITPVGLHPDFISGFNGNPYFCDFMKIDSRNWLIHGADWDGVLQELNPGLINSDGYPIAMPVGSYVNRKGISTSIPANSYFFTNPGQGSEEAANAGYQGRYVLTWKGSADIRAGYGMEYVSGDAKEGVVLNGRRVYKTLAGSAPNGFRVEVRALGGTQITDIRVSMPDPADPWNRSLETGTFHPTFLARIADKNWAYIRFMNMLSCNGNPQRDWVDRRKPNHCFQEGVIRTRTSAPADYVIYDDGAGTVYRPTGNRDTGMSFEYMVELCNTTGKDLWLTVPHMATDDFLHKLAKLIAYGSDGVNPYSGPQGAPVYPPLYSHLNVHLEFSNEVWQWPNDTFSQTIWSKVEADKQGLDVPVFNARQFSRLWSIFELYIPTYRVYRVAAILAADGSPISYTGKLINELYVNPSLLKPEIMSPATYFGSNIQGWVKDNIPNLPGNPADPYWTSVQFDNDLNRMFDTWAEYIFAEKEYGANSGPDAVGLPGGFDEAIHTLAIEKGLSLVAYEGGPSIYTDKMNLSGDTWDDGITIFMNESNRRARIVEMYRIHMNQGLERGIQSHSMFTMSGKWSKYGQWGHLEYLLQNPATAPKYTFMTGWFDSASTLRNVDFPIGSRPYFTTSAFLPLFEVGVFNSQTLGYDSSTVGVEEIATILPAGLYFNLSTMTVSGTPTAAGKGYIYLMITDANGDPAWRTFEVTVLANVSYGPNATVTFESVAAGSVGSGNYKLESYSESGYTFKNLGSTLDILGPNEEFQSQVIQNVGWNQKITLQNSNPSGFMNLTSFDYAAGRWGGVADAIVTGYFISGETKTVTVSSGTKVMATQVVNWDGLVKVEFDYDGGATQNYGTLDNLVLTTGSGGGTVTPPPPPPPPPSGGTTITFEDRTVGTMGSGIYYDASGYTFSDIGWQGPINLEIFGTAEGYESKVLENYSWNRTIEMVKTDGGLFDLASFDHATGRWDGISDALVTATFDNGASTTITVTSSTKVMAIRTVNWTSLKKVTFNYSGGASDQYGALDNIVVGSGSAVPVNTPPVANAGADQTVVDSDGNGSQSATVYGSGTDIDGWITAYSWALNGTTISTTQNLTGNLVVGTHTLVLTVTDNIGATASDTVVVTIQPAPVSGGAVTLTFEGAPAGTIVNGIYYDPAGFTFSDIGWLGPKDLEVFGVAEGYESQVLENYSWSRSIEMTKTDGSLFDLTSFDYATGRWNGVADALVTATFENGDTTSVSVSSSTKTMATRTVIWTNLKKVTFNYAGGATDQYGAIDNVVAR